MSVVHEHAVFVHGQSVAHRLPGVVKLVALGGFVLAVVATPATEVWAFVIDGGLLGIAALAARLEPGLIARRLLAGLPFLLFACALPFVGGGERVEVGTITLSASGLWAAWTILAKGLLCLGASVVVTASTPVSEVLSGLSSLRVPPVLTGIAGFMIRYLDIISAEAKRMRVAMAARGHRVRWARDGKPLAAAAGMLFVRAHERGERVYDAMLARGYDGAMPVMTRVAPTRRQWVAGEALPLVACLVAVVALMLEAGAA